MPASNAQQAAAAAKRKKAIALRLAGMQWDDIAEQAGYASAGAACTAVTEALKKNQRELGAAAAELRETEVARLDRLMAAHWPKALKGDPKSSEIVLKCIAQRSKLLGVEAPAKIEHSGGVKLSDVVAAAAQDAEDEHGPVTV